MDPTLSNFYTMEEHRRKAREAEALKFKKANEDLKQSFYRHTTVTSIPTTSIPTTSTAINQMHMNLAIHDQMFASIMESEYASTRASASCSTDTSSSDSSPSCSDSYSSTTSSSYD